jgi:hypothetical protein
MWYLREMADKASFRASAQAVPPLKMRRHIGLLWTPAAFIDDVS